ncbi:DUF3307 domain-containing protein [Candidatus Peregrinibacteria bacterium]|nr:DUF3307 domain-containing protein [Candidatus Peregrinibacteria bacterium]
MNPLFLAHLIADFLLQPKWLVEWKEKNRGGIVIHAAIHALIMVAVLIPRRFDLFTVVAAIALLHGFIDFLKIRYQANKKNFELFFLADQLAHLAVMIAASFFLSYIPAFWTQEAGRLVFVIFLIFSFGVAWWNLSHLEKFPLKTFAERLSRFALLVAIFALFTIPSLLLSSSFCSWL